MEHLADLASGPAAPPEVRVGRTDRTWAVRRVFQSRSKNARRLSIRFKVFALLLIQSMLVIAAFSILVSWAFDQGFAQYMTAFNDQHAQILARDLESEYAKTGSWDALVSNPRRWDEMATLAAGHKVGDIAQLEEVFTKFQSGDFPESVAAPPMPLPLRFVLLDRNKQLLIGKVRSGATLRELPIRQRGVVVGTLGFPVSAANPYDLQFRQRLLTALGVIIAVSVLIAMLPALFIARFVTRSVSAIGRAARTLATGTGVAPLPVESNDELGDLAQDFNDLSRALERSRTLQRQWLAEISHELRTPVQILMAETEAVMDGMRVPSREGYKSLYDESHRLSRLIDDLHKLSLLDAGMARLQPVEVRITDLLQNCIAAEQTRFSQRRIRVTVKPGTVDSPCVIGDADKLRQVFMNLLENSLRYTDVGGELHIAIEANGDTVHVRFEDSSPGVAEHEIPHLFERLYRGESSRNRASGGAGLGLAIVQSIVETHGGAVSAAPSSLGGLRFDLRFRRAA